MFVKRIDYNTRVLLNEALKLIQEQDKIDSLFYKFQWVDGSGVTDTMKIEDKKLFVNRGFFESLSVEERKDLLIKTEMEHSLNRFKKLSKNLNKPKAGTLCALWEWMTGKDGA